MHFTTMINFFKDGGFFLYPLALILVVGVSIAIERYVYLTRETIRNRELWDRLDLFQFAPAQITPEELHKATVELRELLQKLEKEIRWKE